MHGMHPELWLDAAAHAATPQRVLPLPCQGDSLFPISISPLPAFLPKQIKEQYLECLKENGSDSEACRELAKAYLKCRMER